MNVASVASAPILPVPFRLPVLTYHALDPRRSPITLAPSLFRLQLAALAEDGWLTLTAPQVVELLRLGRRLPPRAVALTFDDGLRSAYTVALPALRDYGFVGTIFPVVSALGGANDWPGQLPGIPTLPLLGWNELGALVRAGWAVGGHTVTHPDLTTLPAARAEEEIAAGGLALAERLGVPVTTFAYPYGRWNAAVRAIVAQHYQGAFTTALAFARGHSDRYAIERIDALYLTPPALMRRLAAPAMPGYLALRRAIRELRARRLSLVQGRV